MVFVGNFLLLGGFSPSSGSLPNSENDKQSWFWEKRDVQTFKTLLRIQSEARISADAIQAFGEHDVSTATRRNLFHVAEDAIFDDRRQR